ncbi:MAG: hypothetical protein ACYCOU_04220 [Sulfobacillus sp.]
MGFNLGSVLGASLPFGIGGAMAGLGGGGSGATPIGSSQNGTNGWAGQLGGWVFSIQALTARIPVAYSVGAGGIAPAGGSQANGNDGASGSDTTFGSLTATGGLGGSGGTFRSPTYNSIGPVNSLMPGSAMPGGGGAGQPFVPGSTGPDGGAGQPGLIIVAW